MCVLTSQFILHRLVFFDCCCRSVVADIYAVQVNTVLKDRCRPHTTIHHSTRSHIQISVPPFDLASSSAGTCRPVHMLFMSR